MNIDGMELISDIRRIYDNYGIETEILAASIRTPNTCASRASRRRRLHVPAATLKVLVRHPLTHKGLEAFTADWNSTGQTIS